MILWQLQRNYHQDHGGVRFSLIPKNTLNPTELLAKEKFGSLSLVMIQPREENVSVNRWLLNGPQVRSKAQLLPETLKFGEALEDYISSRENILSPCTIRDYRGIQRNYIPSLMNIKIDDITQDDIQKAINLEAVKLSPKTVRNIHGLISSALRIYRPSMALNTALPKKKRVELHIPSDAEVKILMNAVQGTELEIPVLLAAFVPMRRGEICALEHSDINGNVIHVCKNMVRTIDNRLDHKNTEIFCWRSIY